MRCIFKTPNILPSYSLACLTDSCSGDQQWSAGYWLTITSHSTKIGHFGDVPQANLFDWYGKKQNLTQQKHTFANQKKCTTTQNKHKKTTARFSCLLQHLAGKRREPILVLAVHKLGTY